jgi:hypothetical protein
METTKLAYATGLTPFSIRKDDLYETPTEAIWALLKAESLPECIWEPACGPGNIVKVLRENGHHVYATDLVDYGLEESESGADFLMERSPEFHVGAIVTNPPYKLATKFVVHALTLCPKVIMLLRLAFLEGTGRSSILDNGHLARVHVFRNRLPRMLHGYTGNRTSSTIAFAWFVWDINHKGPTELHRISWLSK